ncbi:MAG TPA: hypothetical protein VF707_12605, partial [Ardenticatenaceae bacterium]
MVAQYEFGRKEGSASLHHNMNGRSVSPAIFPALRGVTMNKPTILIVDDEEYIAELLSELLVDEL